MPPKPHLHRKADGSLPTASEVARARKLAEIGKDLAWYYQQVDASRNEHNEPTCAECKQPERKKLSSGEIKMLTVDTKNARLVCDSCAQKMYKQSMREKSAQRQNVDGAPTLDAFWTRNRSKLIEEQIAQYEDRQVDTLLLAEEVELCTRAFQTNAPFDADAMKSFIREVCESVSDNGFVLTDIAVVPFFKPEFADFYALWTSGEQVALEYRKSMPLYVKTGYLVALPEHVVYPFFEQVERYLGLPSGRLETTEVRIERIYNALDGDVYQIPDKVILCATPGCKGTQTIGPYEKLAHAAWFCPACESVRNAKAHASLAALLDRRLKDARLTRMVKEAEDRETIFDGDGAYRG